MTVHIKKISSIRILPMICLAIFLSGCGEDEALKEQNAELTTKMAELQKAYQESQLLVTEYKEKAEKAKTPEVVKSSDRENELQNLLRKKNRQLALKSQQLSKAKAECKK